MTLRVRISVVPFGDEEKEREIHQINISNEGDMGDDYLYGVEVDKYKTGEYDFLMYHKRKDGALELVRKVMREVVRNV